MLSDFDVGYANFGMYIRWFNGGLANSRQSPDDFQTLWEPLAQELGLPTRQIFFMLKLPHSASSPLIFSSNGARFFFHLPEPGGELLTSGN